MLRVRRGLSEIIGTLFTVVIVASLLATVMVVGSKFSEGVRESVWDASERLAEASNPPKLVLETVNGSLVLRVVASVPVEISKIVVYFHNGSLIIVNATDDIFEGGQVILSNYSCERVKVAVITGRGNVFYYGEQYYTCGISTDTADGPIYNILDSNYIIYGANYTSQNITVVNNLDVALSIDLSLQVTSDVCRATLTYGGQSSTVASGVEGYSWGSTLDSIALANGVEVRLAPAIYVWRDYCVAGVEFVYTRPSIVRASITMTGDIIISDSIFFSDIRSGRLIVTPIIYSHQARSSIDSSYTISRSTILGSANGYSLETRISDFLALAISTIGDSVLYSSSMQMTVDMKITGLVHVDGVQNQATYPIRGPYNIKLVVPEPKGGGQDLDSLLIRALWSSAASKTKVVVSGKEIRLSSESVSINTNLNSVQVVMRQALEPLILSKIYYRIASSSSNSIITYVTVSYGTEVTAITPPPIILVKAGNKNYMIVATSGHNQPTITAGQTFDAAQAITPGAATVVQAKLSGIGPNLWIDLSGLHEIVEPLRVPPGLYIVNEVYTVSRIKIVTAAVILAP